MENPMSINLLEMITGAIGKDFAPLAGQMFGESTAATSSTMQQVLPAIIGGLISKGSNAGSASGLLGLLNSSQVDAGLLSNVAGLLGGSAANNGLLKAAPALIEQLFGANKLSAIAEAVGSVANVRASSASGIFSLAVPLVMGWLKNHAATNKLDASGLQSLLSGQGSFLQGKLNDAVLGAAGLGTAASFIGGLTASVAGKAEAEVITKPIVAAANLPAPVSGQSMFGKLIPWIIAGLAALFLLSQFRSCSGEKKATEISKVQGAGSVTAPAAPAIPPTSTPPTSSPQAPTTATTSAPPTEAISTPPLLKVFFASDSVAIPSDLAPKVAAFASYAKSSPNTKIGISGYNDKTGDPVKNAELSKNRAKALKDFLISAGVPDDRIILKRPDDTVGSSNDTEARRVEIYVVQ